jgi:hypothetical protein
MHTQPPCTYWRSMKFEQLVINTKSTTRFKKKAKELSAKNFAPIFTRSTTKKHPWVVQKKKILIRILTEIITQKFIRMIQKRLIIAGLSIKIITKMGAMSIAANLNLLITTELLSNGVSNNLIRFFNALV